MSSNLNLELVHGFPDVYNCYDNDNKLLFHSNDRDKQLMLVSYLISDTLFVTNEVLITIVIKS